MPTTRCSPAGICAARAGVTAGWGCQRNWRAPATKWPAASRACAARPTARQMVIDASLRTRATTRRCAVPAGCLGRTGVRLVAEEHAGEDERGRTGEKGYSVVDTNQFRNTQVRSGCKRPIGKAAGAAPAAPPARRATGGRQERKKSSKKDRSPRTRKKKKSGKEGGVLLIFRRRQRRRRRRRRGARVRRRRRPDMAAAPGPLRGA